MMQSNNRKQFTKHCLAVALIELLEKKEYSSISIQDIVDKAGFSRMGYYRNFNTIDEVLDYYLTEVSEDFINSSGVFAEGVEIDKIIGALFNHLCSDRIKNLFLLLVKRHLQSHFYRQFAKRFKNVLYENAENSYVYSFYGSGYFGVYVNWVANGCKETPEELTAIVLNIIKK